MPIQHAPLLGQVLRCDYDLGGFIAPEMVKARPAIVLSPRLPQRAKVSTVVPLSTQRPRHPPPYVVKLTFPEPIDRYFNALTMWAKCDMIAAVSFDRLDAFRTDRDRTTEKRLYKVMVLSPAQFAEVRLGVIAALGKMD